MGKYGERIGSGSYSGDERWHPSDLLGASDREALEAAYGQGPFSDEAWGELLAHLDSFAAFAVVERNSTTVVEMLDMLTELNSAATKLALAIASSNKPEAGFVVSQAVDDHLAHHRTRHEAVWSVLEEELAAELASLGHEYPGDRSEEIVLSWRQRRLFPGPLAADDMIDNAYEIAMAAHRAAESYRTGQEATTSPGDAWKSFVQGLARWAASHRYPNKVSKGSDKAKDPDAASPFVRLVYAIQEHMPPIIRRHHQSKDALASGISRALRPLKTQKRVK